MGSCCGLCPSERSRNRQLFVAQESLLDTAPGEKKGDDDALSEASLEYQNTDMSDHLDKEIEALQKDTESDQVIPNYDPFVVSDAGIWTLAVSVENAVETIIKDPDTFLNKTEKGPRNHIIETLRDAYFRENRRLRDFKEVVVLPAALHLQRKKDNQETINEDMTKAVSYVLFKTFKQINYEKRSICFRCVIL